MKWLVVLLLLLLVEVDDVEFVDGVGGGEIGVVGVGEEGGAERVGARGRMGLGERKARVE